jgi:hypothetical protein
METCVHKQDNIIIIIIIIIIINSVFKEGNAVSKEMLISPETL